MLRAKGLFERVRSDDGVRIWVEPIGLTRELREWCRVDHVLPELGPPLDAWSALCDRPETFPSFRARYLLHLRGGGFAEVLEDLAAVSFAGPLTFVHQGLDPSRHAAAVIVELLGAIRVVQMIRRSAAGRRPAARPP